MKRHQHDELLREIFADGEMDALRENSLQRGLKAMKMKRRGRILRATALGTVLVTALAGIWQGQKPGQSATQIAAASPNISNNILKIYPATTTADAPPVTTISDAELLALFPNCAVGLLGKPGQQKLVFFDQPGKSTN